MTASNLTDIYHPRKNPFVPEHPLESKPYYVLNNHTQLLQIPIQYNIFHETYNNPEHMTVVRLRFKKKTK